ncbi:uncharacterized protein JCM6883_000924 [Sporobolomyces salmoneus]|uniref:uncharacterized protein n=1 Tax=Sporobolomyces salmoneus TaxID=183962 RepID=UPI00317C5A17
MAPPTVHDESEDLDDLDDVLDQFNPTPTTSTAPSTSVPSSQSNPPPSTSFPDPDDDDLPLPSPDAGADGLDDLDLSGLDPAIAKDLEQGMKALFEAFGPGGAGGGEVPGLDGEGEGDFDSEEFRKAMQEIMQEGAGTGATGGEGGEGPEDLKALQELMASLGMGTGAAPSAPSPATTTTTTTKPKSPTTTTKGKDKDSSSSNPSAPADFRDAIAASLSKMQSSSSTASQAAQQSQSSAENAGLASMLAGLSGMPDLSQLGDLGGEEGLQGMLDEMMKQLMSREMLYEPLKELSEKYPAYLALARSTLPPADLERYEKQYAVVVSIVQKFEEPGADKPLEQQTEQEKALSQERTDEVVELVAKMNEYGAPPKQLMGEMPAGMELGPDGVPKIPECTIC